MLTGNNMGSWKWWPMLVAGHWGYLSMRQQWIKKPGVAAFLRSVTALSHDAAFNIHTSTLGVLRKDVKDVGWCSVLFVFFFSMQHIQEFTYTLFHFHARLSSVLLVVNHPSGFLSACLSFSQDFRTQWAPFKVLKEGVEVDWDEGDWTWLIEGEAGWISPWAHIWLTLMPSCFTWTHK